MTRILNVNGNLSAQKNFVPYNGSVVKIDGNVTCGEAMAAIHGTSVEIGGDVNAKTIDADRGTSSTQTPSTVKIGGSAAVGDCFTVQEGCSLEVGKDATYNNKMGNLPGTMTTGGNFINLASRNNVFAGNGLLVTGKLTVGGNVAMNNLLLNYNDEDENLSVAGQSTAYRKADVIKTVDGAYVLDGVDVTEQHPDAGSYVYSVPFNKQTAALTIDGETYAIDVRDHAKKAYAPIKVGAPNPVVYELNGGEFKAGAVIEDSYYTEIGIDMPAKKDVRKVGFIFGGWYDNPDFEGDAATGNHVTELRGAKKATENRKGYTGDLVCTVCGKTIKKGTVIPATVEKLHGERCVCYDITGDSLFANLMRFICAFLYFVWAMQAALGV
ncbi:MAG: hypothetical protein IJL26_10985 [Clostridia bacterium]|nr:hypothetical protein [Clostridia bacterium]